MNLSDILKDSEYKLSQFKPEEVAWLEQSIFLKASTNTKGDVPYIKCLVRGKDIKLTPEEAVRQLYLKVLCDRYHYPVNRIRVEYEVTFGKEKKRADVAIMDKDRADVPYIIVELKKPKLKDGKEQLKSYCNATGSPIGVWTNGDHIEHYQRKDPNFFEKISGIPTSNQTLADVLQKRFTLDDLKKLNEAGSQPTLKAIIDEMEDEVLANAGVDVFEEVFKLIFTKLYDEWCSGRSGQSGKRQLQFYNSGQTETQLKTKIQELFDDAKKKWKGVFKTDDKITLTGSHLSVCVTYLEFCKLFNSNLDVVDEAFEYLINQSSKGEKGQYFTPRYVIDMCVKMLNPKENEAIIDTAAGSSGFPVHTMFHVWDQIYVDEGKTQSDMFTAEEKLPRCVDYVKENVFAIDFDEKAVRVARTLNLIAGDGETNVLHLNTLDYKRWKERIEDQDWQRIYGTGLWRFLEFQTGKGDDYKGFGFDIVMANPPFAGDVKESMIISGYDLVRDKVGKSSKGVGRDILFIERNLDFLKAGGRMAVVLPQGRFNNSSDKYIRDFIADRCRILAVVGLHGNTFKPHTGTKTSVLFVQKWNDDPSVGALCPRKDDYNIFFATMRKSGKDNSGEKIYVKKSDGSGEPLLDDHLHLIVDHDLFNHDGLTEDGIAEAFIEFAKKEQLSFFDLSSSVMPFDAEKYDRLMDELEAVEISIRSALVSNEKFRFDSDFFNKDYTAKLNLIISKPFELLNNIAYITDGEHGTVETNENGYSKYYGARNVLGGILGNNGVEYISKEVHFRNRRSILQPNDILISCVGANIGFAAIVPDDIGIANIVRNVALIRSIDPKFSNFYILAYFLSNYGKNIYRRTSTGNAQPLVILDNIKSLPIPILNSDFQLNIDKLIKSSKELLNASQDVYRKAEDLMLSEIGLKDWRPTDENIAVKSFSASFGTSGRLDAESYQPKYDDLLRQLKNNSCKQLKEIVNIKKSIEPGSEAYQDNGLPFIRVSNLSKFEITHPDIHISCNFTNDIESLKPKKDTILLSKDGSVGIAYKLQYDLEAITSGAIIHLTIRESVPILADYLTLVLNSIIVRLQAERDSGGSIIQHWKVSEIENILIPIINSSSQDYISDNIKKSFEKMAQSKQLLEIAKTGVEKAIEENEEVAINWINEQLESSQP